MKKTGEMTFILMVLSFVFMANSCNKEDENHHNTIEVINSSGKAIYTYFSSAYPDTLGYVGGVPSPPSIYKVEPHEINRTALWRRSFWEAIFRDGRQIPSDTLMVYIYDAELLDTHAVHVTDAIIQRYDLSLQDLQHVNWMLTYPPSPNMSAIKMYPPLGQ